MSQRSIKAGRLDQLADVQTSRRGSRGTAVLKNDLLPLAALLGAVYGWALVLLGGVVAVIVMLVGWLGRVG